MNSSLANYENGSTAGGGALRADAERTVLVLVVEVAQIGLAIEAALVERVHHGALPSPLPDAPDVVAGVLNLHGTVVPVVDLRVRLGLPAKLMERTDRLVVVRTGGGPVALLVDGVGDLVPVPRADFEGATPALIDNRHLAGVATLPEGLLLIGDVDTFLSPEEMEAVDRALVGAGSTQE